MTRPLTAKQVERVKTDPTKRLEISDGGSGLYFVVQSSGVRSWALRYRYRGKPRKLTIGRYPMFGLADARGRARAAREAIDAGRDPSAERSNAKAPDDERDMVPAVAMQFIERYAKPHNRRWQQTARLLGLRQATKGSDELVPVPGDMVHRWGARRVQDITRRDVLEFVDDLVDRSGGASTNRMLAAVRRFFSWCMERDIITVSPCIGVKDPAPKVSRDRVLSDDEIRWIWSACEAVGYPFGGLAQLLLLTLQRRSEVAGMTESELNAAARNWTIPGGRTKNAEPHTVPLSDAALAIINALPRVNGAAGYLFTMNGETHSTGYSRAKKLLDRAVIEIARKERGANVHIPNWTLHDLRRSGASGMARIGIALPVVEKVLNHSSGSFAGIVGVYQRHTYADEKRRALDAWARHIETVTGERPSNVVRLAG